MQCRYTYVTSSVHGTYIHPSSHHLVVHTYTAGGGSCRRRQRAADAVLLIDPRFGWPARASLAARLPVLFWQRASLCATAPFWELAQPLLSHRPPRSLPEQDAMRRWGGGRGGD